MSERTRRATDGGSQPGDVPDATVDQGGEPDATVGPDDVPDGTPALEVRNLTKIYDGEVLAVDAIDFQIADGDFCVLIGPSGCGKSTTLHSIVGNLAPTEGRIYIHGQDVTDTPTYRRNIGLVFQDFQLFPHLTVAANVRYGLDRMGVPSETAEADVADILSLMRLSDIADRLPEELSAGQQQRVALARSLVLEPKVLLLDEPLGDLDYKLQKRLERELLRIHQEFDTTFVYVTHDQTQAMRLADQIIVMNEGQIEQSGSAEAVYNRPATAFVATFVGDSNILTGTVADVVDGGESVAVETPLGRFVASAANLYSEPASVVGETLPFAVRPQFLGLDPTGPNALDCAVSDVISQPGRGTQVVLTATDEQGVATELQLHSPERLSLERDAVTVGWDPADAIMLERTSVVPGIDLERDLLGE